MAVEVFINPTDTAFGNYNEPTTVQPSNGFPRVTVGIEQFDPDHALPPNYHGWCVGFVKVSLAGIPSNPTVYNAWYRTKLYFAWTTYGTTRINAYAVNSNSWNMATLTYSNMPSWGSLIGYKDIVYDEGSGGFDKDLAIPLDTAYVASKAGGFMTIALIMADSPSSGSLYPGVTLTSLAQTSPMPEYVPYFQIVYTVPESSVETIVIKPIQAIISPTIRKLP